MTDTKAPERIWVTGTHQTGSWNRDKNHSAWGSMETEYVRADLLTAAEAERDRLVERVRVITERSDEVERANVQLARIVLEAEARADAIRSGNEKTPGD